MSIYLILDECTSTHIFHIVTVNRNHQRVPANRGRGPRSAVTTIAVRPDEHTLARSLHGGRHEPQFLERIILVGFHDGDSVEAHLVVDGHLVWHVQRGLRVTAEGHRVRLRDSADLPALIGVCDVRLIDRYCFHLDLQGRSVRSQRIRASDSAGHRYIPQVN